MNREEHLAWSKQRALECVDSGDPAEAWAQMLSDLKNHPELRDHAAIQLGTMLLMGGHLSTTEAVRKFIEGFN